MGVPGLSCFSRASHAAAAAAAAATAAAAAAAAVPRAVPLCRAPFVLVVSSTLIFQSRVEVNCHQREITTRDWNIGVEETTSTTGARQSGSARGTAAVAAAVFIEKLFRGPR